MANLFPKTIDFRITSACNMNCCYCFGPKGIESIPVFQFIPFFEEAYKNGCRNIVITGGEPTLCPDFLNITYELRKIGYRLVLSSNGIYWFDERIREVVMKKFDCIGLPLDSADAEVHNYMRGGSRGHFQLIKEIMHDLKTLKPDERPGIKVSTVLCRLNYSEIEMLPDIMECTPDIWKIYQLSRSSGNNDFYDQYHIPEEDFLACLQRVKTRNAGMPTRIVGSLEKERDGKYLFLEPNGDLMTIKNNREHVIASISDDPDRIMQAISNHLDTDKLYTNFMDSFGGRA